MNEEILKVLKSIDTKLTTKGDFDSSDLIDLDSKLEDIASDVADIKELMKDLLDKLGES